MEEATRKCKKNQELLQSAMTWNQEVSRLRQVLADKDRQLRLTLQMRTVDHDNTLNMLNSTMVELEERREEGVPKEDITRLEEEKVEHQRELFEREGRFMERIFKKQNICLQVSNIEENPPNETRPRGSSSPTKSTVFWDTMTELQDRNQYSLIEKLKNKMELHRSVKTRVEDIALLKELKDDKSKKVRIEE